MGSFCLHFSCLVHIFIGTWGEFLSRLCSILHFVWIVLYLGWEMITFLYEMEDKVFNSNIICWLLTIEILFLETVFWDIVEGPDEPLKDIAIISTLQFVVVALVVSRISCFVYYTIWPKTRYSKFSSTIFIRTDLRYELQRSCEILACFVTLPELQRSQNDATFGR